MNWINLSNTLWFPKIIEKKANTLKGKGGFNRLREDTTRGNFGDKTLCYNVWPVRGTLLFSILDNWAVFQELCDGILEGKRGPDITVALKRTGFLFVQCAIHQSVVTSKFKRNVLLSMFLLLLQFEHFHTPTFFSSWEVATGKFSHLFRKLKKMAWLIICLPSDHPPFAI